MAGGMNKPVWLFDIAENPVIFPVPFVDHYVSLPLGEPDKMEDMFKAARGIVHAYGTEERDPLRNRLWLDAGHLKCSNQGCQATFQSNVARRKSPARPHLRLPRNAKAATPRRRRGFLMRGSRAL